MHEIIGADGKLAAIDAQVHLNFQKFIEDIAKDPNLAKASSERVADEVVAGIESLLRTITKKQIALYFEVHRGDHRGDQDDNQTN